MSRDKEKWIDAVFGSLEGSKRAQPNAELFAKIESQIESPEAKIIPMAQWRVAAAAAILLLMLNIFAMRQYTQSYEVNTDELVVDVSSDQQLISNYNPYE